jgi:glutamate racemase
VFDSGIGGLTVASALRHLLPAENIFYIGDTARVPYGGKSQQTIERYSVEITGLLLAEQAKMIVVACNTASALAIPRLQEILKVPVVGVIEPGAKAAVENTRTGRIGVIGTKATVYSRAYERAIHALNPEAQVFSQACPMLVPLIEEGWLDDSITDQIIQRYLEKLLQEDVDTLVLGCTHYPLLSAALRKFAGPAVKLVDSAQNCAIAVKKLLAQGAISAPKRNIGKLRVALTDKSDGFLRVAEEALALQVGDIELRTVQK